MGNNNLVEAKHRRRKLERIVVFPNANNNAIRRCRVHAIAIERARTAASHRAMPSAAEQHNSCEHVAAAINAPVSDIANAGVPRKPGQLGLRPRARAAMTLRIPCGNRGGSTSAMAMAVTATIWRMALLLAFGNTTMPFEFPTAVFASNEVVVAHDAEAEIDGRTCRIPIAARLVPPERVVVALDSYAAAGGCRRAVPHGHVTFDA